MSNEHAGHRKRLRQQYINHGIETFNDINALELLLFYLVPRQDTNLLAHRLLEKFGSLSGVFSAPEYLLSQVEGMGQITAQFFPLLRQLQERAELQGWLDSRRSQRLRTPDNFYVFFRPYFIEKRKEAAYLLCLSPQGEPLGCEKLSQGTGSTTLFTNREAVEAVIRTQAQICVLAHNHPKTSARPSSEDIRTTEQLHQAMSGIGVLLLDHLILGNGEWYSLAQEGYLQQYWE